jgi:hypothetical protein
MGVGAGPAGEGERGGEDGHRAEKLSIWCRTSWPGSASGVAPTQGTAFFRIADQLAREELDYL